jgi:predicted nuclease with TOPRIM domain
MTTEENSDYLTFKEILGKCFRYRGSSRQRHLAELDDFIRRRTERCAEAMTKAAASSLLEKQITVQSMCNKALNSRIDKVNAENVILEEKQALLVSELQVLKLKLTEIGEQHSSGTNVTTETV